MKNNIRIALGVMAGMATGALLGVLFAPDKGKATREKITEKGKDIGRNVKATVDEAGDLIADIKSDFSNHAEHLAHKSVFNYQIF